MKFNIKIPPFIADMKKQTKIICAAVAAVIVVCIVLLIVFGKSGNTSSVTGDGAISSVRIDGENVVITCAFSDEESEKYDGETVYLFKTVPEGNYTDGSELYSGKFDSNGTVKVGYGREGDRFSSYFFAVKNSEGYQKICPPHYIDNAVMTPDGDSVYPEAVSKKGLTVQIDTDAQELGISQAVIDIGINNLLRARGGAGTVSFVFDNKTYYFNESEVMSLDKRVKEYTASGMSVYLRIALGDPSSLSDPSLGCLYFEGSSGERYAINLNNSQAREYFGAFCSFVSERYTCGEYGFAGSYIIGDKVNNYSTRFAAGETTLEAAAENYASALRIADTALRSVYPLGRVYMSISNIFNSADAGAAFGAKEFIRQVNSVIVSGGNIPYRVALDASCSDGSLIEFWNDENTADNSDTAFITMKNINVLREFLSDDEFLYDGETRNILIDGFSVSCDPSTPDISLQAAAIAYAYYKAETLDYIDGFIYSRHTDTAAEAEAKSCPGLLTAATDSTPSSAKKAWEVYRYIDADIKSMADYNPLSVTDFALQLIGEPGFDRIIDGFKKEEVINRTLYESVPVLAGEKKGRYESVNLYTPKKGLCGSGTVGNADYTELTRDGDIPVLRAVGGYQQFGQYTGLYTGLSADANNLNYISLDLYAALPEQAAQAEAIIRVYADGGKYVCKCTADIQPNSWQEITVKTEQLAKEAKTIDSVSIVMRSADGIVYEGEYNLSVKNLTAHIYQGSLLLKIVLWVLIVIAAGAAVIMITIMIMRQKAKKKRRIERMQKLRKAAEENRSDF